MNYKFDFKLDPLLMFASACFEPLITLRCANWYGVMQGRDTVMSLSVQASISITQQH